MSECKTCGRDDGHWIGCAEAARPSAKSAVEELEEILDGMCTFPGCDQPRRSADKRVKFCELHSDPKNRK